MGEEFAFESGELPVGDMYAHFTGGLYIVFSSYNHVNEAGAPRYLPVNITNSTMNVQNIDAGGYNIESVNLIDIAELFRNGGVYGMGIRIGGIASSEGDGGYDMQLIITVQYAGELHGQPLVVYSAHGTTGHVYMC